jgi:hypothetical protein
MPTNVVQKKFAMTTPERQLEDHLVEKLRGLKHEYRGDIRDRAALEKNFRQKFDSLNHVRLTDGETAQDTLYFNAYTEDLFYSDNDLANDRERVLKINRESRFFAGLGELEMDNRIRPLLNRYADYDFKIDTTEWEVSFSREEKIGGIGLVVDDIKVSRGEENIFNWCFFLAIVQLVLDGAEAYKRVIDLMSHGDYSLYEPREMMPENKNHFHTVLKQFITLHPFSPTLFPSSGGAAT